MAIVYRHRRLDTNEIFYIGIGKNKGRAFEKRNRNQYWVNIINKTNYSVEIIQKVDNWEDACELEMFLISEYGRKDLGLGPLVNMTDGGEGSLGFKHSEETKKKQSKFMKGKYIGDKNPNYGGGNWSDEMKLKHSNDKKLKYLGNNNPFFNKTHSIETKEKISKVHKGKTITNENKLKLINANKNKIHTILLDLETGIYYDSIMKASIALGLVYRTLKSQLNRGINKRFLKI